MMPYVWQDAEVFLEHGGVAVYHVYKSDFDTDGRRDYWYGMTPNCRDEGDKDGEFDVRELEEYEACKEKTCPPKADLTSYQPKSIRWLLHDHVVQVIKLAIDNGKLSNEEPYHHFKEDE